MQIRSCTRLICLSIGSLKGWDNMLPTTKRLYLTLLVLFLSISLSSCTSTFKPISRGEYFPVNALHDEEEKTFNEFIIKLEEISKKEFESQEYNVFEDPWSLRDYKREDIFLSFDLRILDEKTQQLIPIRCYDFFVEETYWKEFQIKAESNIFDLTFIHYTPLDNIISFTIEQNEKTIITEYQLERR